MIGGDPAGAAGAQTRPSGAIGWATPAGQAHSTLPGAASAGGWRAEFPEAQPEEFSRYAQARADRATRVDLYRTAFSKLESAPFFLRLQHYDIFLPFFRPRGDGFLR